MILLVFVSIISLVQSVPVPVDPSTKKCTHGPYIYFDVEYLVVEGIGAAYGKLLWPVRIAMMFNLSYIPIKTQNYAGGHEMRLDWIDYLGMKHNLDCLPEDVDALLNSTASQKARIVPFKYQNESLASTNCILFTHRCTSFTPATIDTKLEFLRDVAATIKSVPASALASTVFIHRTDTYFCHVHTYHGVNPYLSQKFHAKFNYDMEQSPGSRASLNTHDSTFRIGYHFRAGDVGHAKHNDAEYSEEYRRLPYQEFIRLMRHLFCMTTESILYHYKSRYDLYVFSEGPPEYFTNMTLSLKEKLADCKLGNLFFRIQPGRSFTDMDEMVSTDIFVAGRSSFGQLAGALRPTGLYIPDNRNFLSQHVTVNLTVVNEKICELYWSKFGKKNAADCLAVVGVASS